MIVNRRHTIAATLATLLCGAEAAAQEASAPAPKPTIAVARVRLDPKTTAPAGYSDNVLAREIEAALDATNRFTVVSRSDASANGRIDEQLATGGGSVRNQRAQFLVTAEVLGIDFRRETVPMPNYVGHTRTQMVGRMQLLIEVEELVHGARQIRSRFPIDAAIRSAPITQSSDETPTSGAQSVGFVDFARQMATNIVDRIRDEMYPVQVVARTGDQIFISRGEDSGYTVGDRLRIFSASGGRLIDPETGDDLGALDSQIGVVQVTEVRPRSTLARIVSETQPQLIARGNLVRR